MAEYAISGDVATLLGGEHTPGDPAALWLESSQPVLIVDDEGRIGGRVQIPLASDGTFTLAGLPETLSGTAPLYRLVVDSLSLRLANRRGGITTGWFPLTTNRTLTWIVANYVPVTVVTAQVASDIAAATSLSTTVNARLFETLIIGTTAALTPAAASAATNTELYATAKTCRRKLDLASATQARLVGMVIANGNDANAAYKLSYCTTEASTWSSGTGVANAGPSLVVGSAGGGAGVLHDTGWVTLTPAARIANCYLTLLVGSAIGTTPPTVGSVSCYFR